jgi:hypothetical protein
MAREIPEVVRAAAGLAAIVLDETRKLPETLPGLPVRVIGLAMQQAMKVQQHYAGLVARGDELFTGLRGEDEPGLATFDDDLDTAPPSTTGFRNSAFDRADAPAPTVEEVHLDAPETDELLDELAIDEMVEQAPTLDETADVATTADVLTADGTVESVDATVTDEGVAAPEAAPEATPEAVEEAAPETPAEAPGAPSTTAPTTAPIDGYDDFSIAQLRGRMRGYALSTLAELVAYEEATKARAPYLSMLRNRLEKVEEQAVESSPLAPRGA